MFGRISGHPVTAGLPDGVLNYWRGASTLTNGYEAALWQQFVPREGLDPGIHKDVALATALGLVPENWVKESAALNAPATRGDAAELLFRLYFPEARKKISPGPAAAQVRPSIN